MNVSEDKKMWPVVYILVADRSGARLFKYRPGDTQPSFLRGWTFPQGRLRNQQINADKPGHTFPRRGYGWSSLMNKREPVDQNRIRWALRLARILRFIHLADPMSGILLAAEPKLLGDIRKSLSASMPASRFTGVPKDFAHFDEGTLWRRLKPYVNQAMGRPEWMA